MASEKQRLWQTCQAAADCIDDSEAYGQALETLWHGHSFTFCHHVAHQYE